MLSAKPIERPDTLTVAQKKRAYELGGFAFLFLNREKNAERYFELLFKLDPRATVDERRYPPKATPPARATGHFADSLMRSYGWSAPGQDHRAAHVKCAGAPPPGPR